jgi:ABC-type multidrug transport system fused ATPase/permease subunit
VQVIAHRLTTTKHCDNIFVMDHGTVAEEAHRQVSKPLTLR